MLAYCTMGALSAESWAAAALVRPVVAQGRPSWAAFERRRHVMSPTNRLVDCL
jgi:hypothetical protein